MTESNLDRSTSTPLTWSTDASDIKAARHIENSVGASTQPCYRQGCALAQPCKAGLCSCSDIVLNISGGFYITSSSRPSQGCIGIIYHTDGELFNMRRLKANTKVKATSIADLQYADDCTIAARMEAALQNTLDAFSEAHKLLGLTVNVTKTTVMFQPAQPLAATAPNIGIEGTMLQNVDHFAYLCS